MECEIFKKHDEKLSYKITNRSSGVSVAPYESLNLALHVGDDPLKVLQNRSLLAKEGEFFIDNLIFMEQTHGDNIQIIKDSSINHIKNCDAIITNVKNIPLMVMVADCIPILLYDSVKNVIAVVHAGRNGTFKEIAKKTVLKMVDEFGVDVSDVLVYLGASIHSCCYEIGSEIADIATKSYIIKRDKKLYLDLQSMNENQLLSVGISKENIEISDICTCCDKEYFSYRRDGVTGRFAGILWIKKL